MLAWRLLSAAVGIPLLIALVLVGGRAYDAVLALTLAAAVAEVLVQAGMPATDLRLWAATAATAALSLSAAGPSELSAAVLTLLVIGTLTASLARDGARERVEFWSLSVALPLYVGGLGRYLALLRHVNDGRSWVFFALFVTFASDTGAYAVGRLLGRHRLAPTISPGKTLEGVVGGLLAAAVAAPLLAQLLRLSEPPLLLGGLGLGVSVAAQLGDLCESALKRRLNIKDAGSLVPGHGGLLDRLDSLLFSSVLVYCFVKWMSL
jgi:phosphatidate cytidylyltransferase